LSRRARAALVATLLTAVGCGNPDVCQGVSGTCVSLHVVGGGGLSRVDQLAVTLSGADVGGPKRTPSTPLAQSLPINVALTLHAAGATTVDVVAYLSGRVVGHGSSRVTINGGAHSAATLTLAPASTSGSGQDLSVAVVEDMAAAPADFYIANRDMAGSAKPLGAACAVDDQCGSGHCIDGVCCLTACNDACHACNLPSSLGECAPLANGVTPLPGHDNCGPDPVSGCMRDGACNGNGACRLYQGGTVCAASTCVSGTYSGPSHCDGAGSCVRPAASTCAPYVCKDTTQCWPSCTGNTQCQSPAVCNTSVSPGSCGLKANGAQCQGGGDCLSGKCTDSVCCTSSDCGKCAACNLNGQGTCSSVAAGGADPKNSCAMTDTSTCGTDGTCDGKGGCRFWVSGTVCAAGDCGGTNSNTPINYQCDGAGTCNEIDGAPCKPAGCTAGVCYDSCGDYEPLHYCQTNASYCAPGCGCFQPDGGDRNDNLCFKTKCGGC
jgi:hypothetical protein